MKRKTSLTKNQKQMIDKLKKKIEKLQYRIAVLETAIKQCRNSDV